VRANPIQYLCNSSSGFGVCAASGICIPNRVPQAAQNLDPSGSCLPHFSHFIFYQTLLRKYEIFIDFIKKSHVCIFPIVYTLPIRQVLPTVHTLCHSRAIVNPEAADGCAALNL
jgi:hypothetical protein